MQIFICGSHTDAGKTSVSAALCYAYGFEYFKLIQAGIPTDSHKIQELSPKTKIHPQGILLKTPASPHIGMQRENIKYNGLEIPLPHSNHLLIESAGGLFTPLDSKMCMIDYLEKYRLPTLLVGSYYLGGINHILLSIEALKQRNIEILGLIISKEQNPQMDDFIQNYTQIKIAHFHTYTKDFQIQAQNLKQELEENQILISK